MSYKCPDCGCRMTYHVGDKLSKPFVCPYSKAFRIHKEYWLCGKCRRKYNISFSDEVKDNGARWDKSRFKDIYRKRASRAKAKHKVR